MPDLKETVETCGHVSDATTLGELLAEVESKYGSKFELNDLPKYFRYYEKSSSPDYVLVDIHITRDGLEICPKQDMGFPLAPNDIVEAGVLIC